jgi:hypothetical protein
VCSGRGDEFSPGRAFIATSVLGVARYNLGNHSMLSSRSLALFPSLNIESSYPLDLAGTVGFSSEM